MPISYTEFDPFTFVTPRVAGIFQINCFGAKTRRQYMPAEQFDIPEAPREDEELFEWIDLLDAIASAEKKVTVIDLGAGFGRWLVNAALAAKQLCKSYHVVGVEAEPTHFSWMLEHFADNGVAPPDYTAIKGVVSDSAREVYFVNGHPAEWYGQGVLESADMAYGDWPDAHVNKSNAIDARQIVQRFPVIDALHMDLQGEEARVVPSIIEVATRNVRRMHVGTHSDLIDRQLPQIFQRHGWKPRFQFPCKTKAIQTEYGKIDFEDGVQSWENPSLPKRPLLQMMQVMRRKFVKLF